MTALSLLRDALLALSATPFVYYAIAIAAAAKFFRRKTERAGNFFPPVSVLKPIRGLDRDAYENFASLCRQDYPEFEILFCVSDPREPAMPVLLQLIRDFPARKIRVYVGADPLGASDKVNKLCRMAREAKNEILIVSDSDVCVEPGFLAAAAAPFADPSVGGVTCLYRGITDDSLAANLEALGNSADFAPGVLVAWLLGGKRLNFMLGAVMATTKKQLAEIGGFESLVDYFCDDYELGNRIAARSRRVELIRTPVDIVYPRESLGEAFEHQIRWNLSIRFSRPAGHLGLLFTHGLPWAILGLALAHSWAGTFFFVGGYALLRYEVALGTGARGMRDPLIRRRLWMLPVRDAFAFLVWLASFFPRRIRWRDREFWVREKRLVPVPPAR
ncbi:MAG: bacteriohopanetetrol glucosamine biosynthesis glycosyltransferase HpnI [Candidatus Acidiferrales bacterium]